MASNRSLGTLTLNLIANVGGFTSALDKASRETDRQLSEMEQRAYNFGRSIGTTIRAGLALLFGGELISGISNATRLMDELGKSAQKVGLPVEQFSTLAAAAQLSNVNTDALVDTLGRYAQNIGKAVNATSQQAKIFSALGISIKDQNGNLRSSSDLMLDFATQLQQLGVNTTTTAAGIALFGRRFQDIIPFLSQGADSIRQAQDEAIELGAVLSGDTAAAAAQFEDDLGKIKLAARGLGNQLVQGLLPVLNEWADYLTHLAKDHDDLGQKITVLTDTVKVLEIGALAIANVFDVLGDEINWAAVGVGQFVQKAGALKDLALTPVGSIKDIKDAWKQFGISWKAAGTAAVESTDASFSKMVDSVTARTERINKLFASIGTTAKLSIGAMERSIVRLSEQVDAIAEKGAKGPGGVLAATKQIAALGAAAIKAGDDVGQVQSVIAAGVAKLQQVSGNPGKLAALQAALNPRSAQQAEKLTNALEALGNAVAKVNESSDPQQKAYNTYADTVRNLDQLGAKAIKAGASVKYVQGLVAQGVSGAQSKLQHDLQAPILAAQAYKDALDQQLATQKAANDAAAAAVGIGSQQAQEQQQLNKVMQDGAQAVANFTKQHADAIAQGDPQYARELADLKQYWADVLKVTQDGQAQLHDAQSDWLNGVNKAWDDFVAEQNNTAQITGQLTTDFLNQGSNAFASFIDGTKSAEDALTDFINSFEQEITQAVSKQLLKKLFNLGGDSSGNGGLFTSIFSGIGSLFGPGTIGAGLAGGGRAQRGSLHPVNERGTELLSVGGRDYLMMGAQSGTVTPNNQLTRSGSSVNNNFYLAAPTSMKTQSQIANKAAYEMRRASRLS